MVSRISTDAVNRLFVRQGLGHDLTGPYVRWSEVVPAMISQIDTG